jgi:pilus assembly protein Flp/PilA
VGQLTCAGQVLITWSAEPVLIVSLILARRPFGVNCPIRRRNDTMKKFVSKVQRFMKSEDGPTAVEYAIMLALIVIVCLAAITAVGNAANTAFTNIAGQLQALPTE